MNFLMRTTQNNAAAAASEIHEPSSVESEASTSLEGLISEITFSPNNGSSISNMKNNNQVPLLGNHSDVTQDEGWITIPYKELSNNWSEAADILSFRSLDRSFVFPGEQVHILACLSASKKDMEIITPFKVAAVMSKNGILGNSVNQQKVNTESDANAVTDERVGNDIPASNENSDRSGEALSTRTSIDSNVDISASESLLRMEDYRKQTETQLEKFKNSHFFVRIAESDEPLWSKRSTQETATSSSLARDKFTATEANAYIDRGSFDANVSGGVARDAVKCCSLPNGDIVMLLQVNVGTYWLKDPMLEVLQFEKYQDRSLGIENKNDPCGDLLKWLLPLDRSLSPPVRPLSPPPTTSPGISSISLKSSTSHSSGSQLFSFGNFRSYSMSSLPPNSTPPPPPITPTNSKPTIDVDEWSRFSPQKSLNSPEAGGAGLLSFRGVPLEPDRFSVHCGLEGIYMPGRRWRKKLEIVQPVQIRSFASECNTEDLLCVQIKNVTPPHMPDIIIYIDTIAIVFEEAPQGGPPVSLPITCVEAGNDYSLPNLPLRRNEEHSFILKPATSMWKSNKVHSTERGLNQSQSKARSSIPNLHLPPKIGSGKRVSGADQYAVLVSCRCNYTESRLFFKQPTSWRPRFTRDLMISVASEMSEQSLGPNGGLTQLPVQVLTLQASNLTAEDITLTVLAPASLTSPPSVVSLSSTPSTPMSPFVGFSEFAGERRNAGVHRQSSMPHGKEKKSKEKGSGSIRSISFDEQTVCGSSDVVPASGLGCTHLWLQSAVPLGCVPSQSTATVKLELLPLTDGIITLDTLQINVKEKGVTYIPEHSLKIYATSSIATGIV